MTNDRFFVGLLMERANHRTSSTENAFFCIANAIVPRNAATEEINRSLRSRLKIYLRREGPPDLVERFELSTDAP